ncbi:response regulator transcription factor [Hufsiella ginkgonis]|uniref:Response regulator n=1 Tax=Hufsiella ginkgonis TaxID=2695274 RepID=A0A7K1XSU4_9SPHI|nr:response regulator transcription factor [Hufsiella ginkgonis]MXV14024.1 response regulator [Hufsiella ginkgonis]
MKLLLVEDETGLAESIIGYFSEDGTVCELAGDYGSGSEKICMYDYDCILLDLSLPGGDGLRLLEELKRMDKQEGVLIISARNSLDDRLKGLNLGADDYLTKPFHLSELKARVIAIVRRKQFGGSNRVIFNEIAADLLAMNVTVKGVKITLTRKEFDLLVYLVANQGKVVSKNAIAEHLWGDEMDLSDRFDFIYTHIKNLRKKLVEAGAKDYLKSMYGVGYKFGSEE